jgi:hypothetical protein
MGVFSPKLVKRICVALNPIQEGLIVFAVATGDRLTIHPAQLV